MKHVRTLFATMLPAALGLVMTTSAPLEAAQSKTRVTLNGKVVPVSFNDGDSFRVLGGTYNGVQSRLFGYNTLESYGPVHQWGSWTFKELYVIAKMATYYGRKGVWECETDGKTDTYGRILVWCPELAEAMVREGYAHAMSIDDNAAKPELVAAQAEAIRERRGIWAHGVPEYVLTSLHSAEEDVDGKGTYNRLVSSKDGHSVKWRHNERHSECDRVCHYVYAVDDAKVDEVTGTLRQDGPAAKWLKGLSEEDVRSVVYDFARDRHINRKIPKDQREGLHAHLSNYVQRGRFGDQAKSEGSCMIHVAFKRRYGEGRAACLK